MQQKSLALFRSFRSENLKSKTCPFDRLRAGSEPSRRNENLKWVGIAAIVLTFALGGVGAEAQQPKKIPRIGYLAAGSALSASSRIEAFREGLRELGYIEGKNIVIEWRFA